MAQAETNIRKVTAKGNILRGAEWIQSNSKRKPNHQVIITLEIECRDF